MRRSRVLVFMLCVLSLGSGKSSAAGEDKAAVLSAQIINARNNNELGLALEAAKAAYFKESKYNEFADFLKTLPKDKKSFQAYVDYYTGLCRYSQLKYLEVKQLWDEYFNQGNDYRDQITSSLEQAIKSSDPQEESFIYAKLLLWQFHRDQQDVFQEKAFTDLISSTGDYAKEAKVLDPIKAVADKLLAYDEKPKARELYRVYFNKLVSTDLKDEELNSIALNFLKEGNLELAEVAFDHYTDKIIRKYPQEQAAPWLKNTALLFTYYDRGPNDPVYAEKIFKKIEEASGRQVFDEELTYLRGFNLEKIKEFNRARDCYLDLLSRFPQTKYADQAEFKIAIISLYVLSDEKVAQEYFTRLAQKDTVSFQVVSSLYYLGLLNQWQEKSDQAKEYYNKLLLIAQDRFSDTVKSAKERLAEIEGIKSLNENIKRALDSSLGDEASGFDMSKVDIKTSVYNAAKDEEIKISASAIPPQSGCMQVVLDYLWSGDLGRASPANEDREFSTSYSEPGIKVISLVVLCPTGVLDKSIDIIDVK